MSEWIAVRPETMPGTDETVLVLSADGVIVCGRRYGPRFRSVPGQYGIPKPTHYMPLPAPPVLS